MWDVVVIGLGGVGSFTLRASSQILKQCQKRKGRGKGQVFENLQAKVLGIEKFIPCHEFGSSHGHSRIYRHAYFEDPKYVPLIQSSTKEFQKLQQDRNIRLMEECGVLMIEDAANDDDNNGTNNSNADGNNSLLSKCKESAMEHNIHVESLSSKQLIEMYPQFQNLNNMNGLLEYNGGFVRPELAIQAALDDARDNGAIVWDNTIVNSIREVTNNDDDSLVEISLSRGEHENKLIQSRKVIIAAGAWTTKLLPSWSNVLKVTRQIQAWVDISSHSDPDTSVNHEMTRSLSSSSIATTPSSSETTPKRILYDPTQMPVWYISTKQLDLPFYGIPTDPCSSNPTHIKIALHGRDVEIDPNLQNPPVTKEEKEELEYAFQLFFRNSKNGNNDEGDNNIKDSDNNNNNNNGNVNNKNNLTITDAKACMYTMTPDENFLVGKPHGYKNVYAAAGLSGHGFKMVPGLGKVLADMALQQNNQVENEFKGNNDNVSSKGRGKGETELDVNFLSPSRFGV